MIMTLHLLMLSTYKYSPTVDQVTCPGVTLPPPPTPTMPEEIAPPQPSQPPPSLPLPPSPPPTDTSMGEVMSGKFAWIIGTITGVGVLVVMVVLAPIVACAVYTRRKAREPEPTSNGDTSSGERYDTFRMKENGAYANHATFPCHNSMGQEQAKQSVAVKHNQSFNISRGNTLEYDYVITY